MLCLVYRLDILLFFIEFEFLFCVIKMDREKIGLVFYGNKVGIRSLVSDGKERFRRDRV